MRKALSLAALAFALLPWSGGCKKPAPPPVVVAKPTPTPVPLLDGIVFSRGGALWTANGNGDGQRVLAAPARGQSFWLPTTLPDGSAVLAWLSRSDGTQDIVRVDLDGRVTPLTDIGTPALPPMKSMRLGNAPAVSPDGKRIAYAFNGDLWVMDANGYNAVTLIADGASYAPSFSPDGKRLAYLNGHDDHYDAWVTDLNSNDTYQVTDFEGYSVGRPQWTPNGQRLLLTRVRGDESDLVQVLAATDTPLADADVLTRDHLTTAAIYSPSGTHLLFSSARGDGQHWEAYVSDIAGQGAKALTQGGGLSPVWLKNGGVSALAAATPVSFPGRQAPAPMAVAPGTGQPPLASAPTPRIPSATALRSAGPAVPAITAAAPASSPLPARPLAVATAIPLKPAPAPTAMALASASPKPAVPAAAPAAAPQAAAPAPTQPPMKAAPLRLRYRAGFDSKDRLTLDALANLKKLAPRVQQYATQQVSVIGPLDNAPLKGRYASAEDRSEARAKVVALQLARLVALPVSEVQSLPYSPPSSGGEPNSIQVYVELK